MKLTTRKRSTGNGRPKKIRKEGFIPAVIYGKGVESVPITVKYKEFMLLFREAGEATLIDMEVEGEKDAFKVLVKDLQYDPISDKVSHLDFYKVNLKDKVEAAVPIHLENEPEMVASGEALVMTLLHEVTVEALPLNLPSEIVVDVSRLMEIGDVVTVGDLAIDRSKVEIKNHEDDEAVVKLDYAETPEEPEEEEVLEEAEVEITKEKAINEREEGREPAKEEELKKGQQEGKEETQPSESKDQK